MARTLGLRLCALLAAIALVTGACSGPDAADDLDDITETTEVAGDEGDDGDVDADRGPDDLELGDEPGDEGRPTTAGATPSCMGESDGVLTIAGLLPQTGNLAFLGPPAEAGAALALRDINDAGGVLGNDVVFLPGDSSDNGDVANQIVDRGIAEGADAFLGASSSDVSLTVIDKITGACKIQFSPANTSPEFTDYADDELYFRTAASDVLQGRVLADLIVAEGSTTVGLMAPRGSYGEGLVDSAATPLAEQGATVVDIVVHDPRARGFEEEVGQMVAADPEAIVVIGFDETARILTGLFAAGFGPDVKRIYLVDGNMSNALGERFGEPGVLSGIRGTVPAPETVDDFETRLLAIDPGLIDTHYGPQAYDAVIVMALAAEAAGTDDPSAVAAEINGITRDGEKCTSFAECRLLIAAGADIDYDGSSGPLDFGPAGEPSTATFAILSYAGDSNIVDESLTEYRSASLE